MPKEVDLQEKLKKVAQDIVEPAHRSVTLCLKSKAFILAGIWDWDMHGDALYCSEVMYFPEDFMGTKAIIHPDDVAKVTAAMELIKDREILSLEFRVITTYGELRTIKGLRVKADVDKEITSELLPGKEEWQKVLQQLAWQKEADLLHLRSELTDLTEHHNGTGGWLINKGSTEAWYSDNAYRIYGLAPQSLNAHANTFYRFIHPNDRVTVLDAFERSYTDELPLHIEFRIVLADGVVRYVKVLTDWIFNAKGQHIFAGIIKDISEERAIADELYNSQTVTNLHQQVLRFAEQQSSTGYFYLNLVTRKSVFSENYYRIYGFKQPQLPNFNSFVNLVHPEDRARISEVSENVFTQHILPETEYRILRPDGKTRYLKLSGKLFVKTGVDLTMIGVIQDITVIRGLEKKIEEQGQVFSINQVIRELIETQAGLSSIIWLPDGYMQWSDGLYKWLGYKPGAIEPLPRMLHRHIDPEDLKLFKDAELKVVNHQQQEPVTIRLVSRLGQRLTKITFYVTGVTNEPSIGVLQDIGSATSLQQQLSHDKKLKDLVASSVNDVLILTNTDHIVTMWNEKAEEKTGIPKSDALYNHLFDVLPNLNEVHFLVELNLALKGNEFHSVSPVYNCYLKKAHHYHLWPLRDEEETTSGVLHVVQDVSKELELQKQLSERLSFIGSLVESSVDPIIVLDRFMNYLYWNKKAENYYAINKERVLGKNILEVFPSFRNHPGYSEFRKVLKGETVYLPPDDIEGEDYQETYLTPIIDETGDVSAVLWTVHDLTERRDAEKKLLEEHRRLKEAQKIGRVGSFEWNLSSGEIFWSDEMFRIYGIEAGASISPETLFSTIHRDDRADAIEKIQMCREEPCNIQIAHRIIRPDGEVGYLIRIMQSFADREGKISHITGTVQDITELKLAELEVSYLRSEEVLRNKEEKITEDKLRGQLKERTMYAEEIIDSSIDRMFVLDQELRITAWNKRSEIVTGIDKAKALGNKIFDLFPKMAGDKVIRGAIKQAADGQYVYLPAKKALYTNAWYERFYIPLQNEMDQTYGILVIMHDVTDIIMKEQELRELNKTLAGKNTELEQKNEEITHFSFVASKDLQEPLRKIHSFSNWILEQEVERLSPMAINFTKKIMAAVRRMEMLIEDILVLTKIQSDQQRNDDVNLSEILEKVKDDMANEIRFSGAEIEAGTLPTIKANSNQVFYLFRNLLSNAIKYQSPGNVPFVKISSAFVQGEKEVGLIPVIQYLRLTFEDNGFGIETKNEKKIFQAFSHLHTKGDFEGTGVGLAICKKIMENHGGFVTVESERAKGSKFHCFFPI